MASHLICTNASGSDPSFHMSSCPLGTDGGARLHRSAAAAYSTALRWNEGHYVSTYLDLDSARA